MFDEYRNAVSVKEISGDITSNILGILCIPIRLPFRWYNLPRLVWRKMAFLKWGVIERPNNF